MTNTTSALIEHASAIHLQTEDNDPRQARIELLKLVDKFNRLLDALGSAAFKNIGIAEGNLIALGEGGTLPQQIVPSNNSNIPTSTILDFFASSAPTGWVAAHGQGIQIGNGDEYFPLYEHLFNAATNITNPLPLFSTPEKLANAKSKGTARQAWSSSLSVPLPDLRGRTRITNGSASDITEKFVGQKIGEENTRLERTHLPNEPLNIIRGYRVRSGTIVKNFLISQTENYKSYTKINDLENTTEPMGQGTSHNNMQPSFVVLTCMKL